MDDFRGSKLDTLWEKKIFSEEAISAIAGFHASLASIHALLEFRNAGFCGRWKTRQPREKHPEQDEHHQQT